MRPGSPLHLPNSLCLIPRDCTSEMKYNIKINDRPKPTFDRNSQQYATALVAYTANASYFHPTSDWGVQKLITSVLDCELLFGVQSWSSLFCDACFLRGMCGL